MILLFQVGRKLLIIQIVLGATGQHLTGVK